MFCGAAGKNVGRKIAIACVCIGPVLWEATTAAM